VEMEKDDLYWKRLEMQIREESVIHGLGMNIVGMEYNKICILMIFF